MRYFFRHLYFCLQSTHLSITIELNNVDSSGLVFFWARSLLGLFDRGADLLQSGDGRRLSQPGWCMQASTACLPPPSYSGSETSSKTRSMIESTSMDGMLVSLAENIGSTSSSRWISIGGRGGMVGSSCMRFIPVCCMPSCLHTFSYFVSTPVRSRPAASPPGLWRSRDS